MSSASLALPAERAYRYLCDAVLPKRAAVNQPILLDFLFLYGSDPIIVYMDPNITYICYFGKRYCSLTQHLLAISTHREAR